MAAAFVPKCRNRSCEAAELATPKTIAAVTRKRSTGATIASGIRASRARALSPSGGRGQRGRGGRAVMTSSPHACGSDRIAEAVRDLDFDLVVNVQGDLPLLSPADIDAAVGLAERSPGAIATLKHRISDRAMVLNPNVVKVTTDLRGVALYFSRSPIPWLGPEGSPRSEEHTSELQS